MARKKHSQIPAAVRALARTVKFNQVPVAWDLEVPANLPPDIRAAMETKLASWEVGRVVRVTLWGENVAVRGYVLTITGERPRWHETLGTPIWRLTGDMATGEEWLPLPGIPLEEARALLWARAAEGDD